MNLTDALEITNKLLAHAKRNTQFALQISEEDAEYFELYKSLIEEKMQSGLTKESNDGITFEEVIKRITAKRDVARFNYEWLKQYSPDSVSILDDYREMTLWDFVLKALKVAGKELS